ncbi:MAG: sensor histidine kinase N-terminal domain-containing protein [Zoogloeaceae bacterium]|nr:sensor histidine kinase N-terminal domain-containing protein [Zoogloeaceae bacterium]
MSGCFAQRANSLRWRLLCWVTLATVLIWGIAAALSYHQARREVQELMDGQMAKTARLLLAQVHDDAHHLDDLPANMASLRGTKVRRSELILEFRIARANGEVLVSTEQAPSSPIAANGNALGYANIEHKGRPWRSLILETANGSYRVQVAHSFHSRDKEALEIAVKTVLPLALLLPLLIVTLYFSIRRGLKPLDDLANDVATRSPENMTPLSANKTPSEARPLVGALNQLLGRLAGALDNERRFTADAAHELRTPLAALKVQAQVAMASLDPEASRHALMQVLAGADRSTRLVEQLLRLARLDPVHQLPDPQPINLIDVAATAVRELSSNAATKAQTLRLLPSESPIIIAGDIDLLSAAVRNLIDNALRYTPTAGRVTVTVDCPHGEAIIEINDNGPGVPPEELAHLVERFYRGRDVSAEGSGLGLAIVRRIAELHGARLEVANLEGGGFSARLRWCSPQPPAL